MKNEKSFRLWLLSILQSVTINLQDIGISTDRPCCDDHLNLKMDDLITSGRITAVYYGIKRSRYQATFTNMVQL